MYINSELAQKFSMGSPYSCLWQPSQLTDLDVLVSHDALEHIKINKVSNQQEKGLGMEVGCTQIIVI